MRSSFYDAPGRRVFTPRCKEYGGRGELKWLLLVKRGKHSKKLQALSLCS
jgi:hypothetical protein